MDTHLPNQPTIHWDDGTLSFILVFDTAEQASLYQYEHTPYLDQCEIERDINGFAIDLAMIPQLVLQGKVL